MTIAVFPGSFDPLTMGHLSLIKRASRIFDQLIVTVGINTNKKALFSVEERLALINESVADISNVSVQTEAGLTVQFVRSVGANVIVRGIRDANDLTYEANIANMNRYLDDQIETVFLATDPEYAFISSSLLKEVLHFKGDVSKLVPAPVAAALERKEAAK